MFVIVEMGLEPSDVKQIKLTRSLFQVIRHYVYNLVRKFFRYQQELFEDFTLYDNGMKISDSFIPYEYIVAVTNKEMFLLARRENEKLVPSDNLICIKFTKSIDPFVIKNNLYYHLKYNEVSTDILKYKTVQVGI
jgi:hypothetical protein